jgi:hypothetical protein
MKNIKSFNYFLKESEHIEKDSITTDAFDVASDIMKIISTEEAKMLVYFYKQNGKEKLAQVLTQIKENEMPESEKKIRQVIDKIIKGLQIIGGATPVGIVTGNWELTIGLGICAIAGEVFKDAAWWNSKEGSHESQGDESIAK